MNLTVAVSAAGVGKRFFCLPTDLKGQSAPKSRDALSCTLDAPFGPAHFDLASWVFVHGASRGAKSG